MFLLPVKGGSGGAHSVMQEAEAMSAMGVPVTILVNAGNAEALRQSYDDMPHVGQRIVAYESPEHLSQIVHTAEPVMVVATTNQSVHTLAAAGKNQPHVRTGYYIQDYEPLFYDPDSADWRLAYSSYGLIPGMVHYAKTRWLQEVVLENHGVSVAKVEPSIDHGVYYPDLSEVSLDSAKPLRITAMLRPATPRRAPHRTVRVLNALEERHKESITVTVFGSSQDELDACDIHLNQGIEQLGPLRRKEVGDLMRRTDLFLDLSDFQAFGRTAIEAMSCGAVSLVPAHGGAHEFGIDGKNCFIVDTRFDDLIVAAAESFISASPEHRRSMRFQAIETGFRFTVERAALSELAVILGAA